MTDYVCESWQSEVGPRHLRATLGKPALSDAPPPPLGMETTAAPLTPKEALEVVATWSRLTQAMAPEIVEIHGWTVKVTVRILELGALRRDVTGISPQGRSVRSLQQLKVQCFSKTEDEDGDAAAGDGGGTGNGPWVCRYPGCNKFYTQQRYCRAHALKCHPVWIRQASKGQPSEYCEYVPAIKAISAIGAKHSCVSSPVAGASASRQATASVDGDRPGKAAERVAAAGPSSETREANRITSAGAETHAAGPQSRQLPTEEHM